MGLAGVQALGRQLVYHGPFLLGLFLHLFSPLIHLPNYPT
jgi:hypothetical protein